MDRRPERMVGVDTAAVGIAGGTTMVSKGAGNIIVMEMTTDNWRSAAPIVFSLFRSLRRPGKRAFLDDIPSKRHISHLDARK
jgi:hypothetical protein